MIWMISVAAFFVSLALFWIGIKLAHRFDITDRPGGRKHHDGAVPLIGGLVIIPVFTKGVVWMLNNPNNI